jgi:predicted DNA-binding transcriptional regulator YafY
MNRFDRALGILLLLRSGRTRSAAELARRFEVSPRTIYRDIETLSAVGVPVYAEQGRGGGFRLVEGYFLPPITFSAGEATSLLTGLALLRRLRARPFPIDLDAAGAKLLAALPEHLRATLAETDRIIGFEATPHDSFHPDLGESDAAPDALGAEIESQVITTFLQCILDRHTLTLEYRAPHRAPARHQLAPDGLLWDRDRWYLVARRVDRDEAPRLWRADRVLAIASHMRPIDPAPPFDVAGLLGRRWLDDAMAQWAAQAPVSIRMTAAQAARLKRDWYYGHACFDEHEGDVLMSFGESDRQVVFALLRWLGPGAELIAPAHWRAEFAAEVRALLAQYESPASADIVDQHDRAPKL